jgi:hypothetical protein
MREGTPNMLALTFHLLGGKLDVLLSHHKVLNWMGLWLFFSSMILFCDKQEKALQKGL